MIRTRIAPSPTGEDIHIGNLYTAYLNWVFAKKNGGKFIIRIEDTDRTRLVPGAESKILASLRAYGIVSDEDVEKGGPYAPYRQSERLSIYKKYCDELIQKGNAYYCTCSKERLEEVRRVMQSEKKVPKYDKYCVSKQKEIIKEVEEGKPYVIRLNVPPNTEVVFHDLIRGEVKINTDNIDDQVLMKSDGYPTYHLAVVVDDYLMQVSHVIRAEEWISSTPKHVLLYQAFGWELPVFAHLPILRNPDKSKLSKRKNPVWAAWYLSEGFLPEAVLNYLSLMGWSHPDGKEIFSHEEFVQTFSLERIQPVGPVFDITKLTWMNGRYIMALPEEELEKRILQFYAEKSLNTEIAHKSIALVRERIKTLKEYWNLASFLFEKPNTYEQVKADTLLLEKVVQSLESMKEWNASLIGETLQNLATHEGIQFGTFFMMMRVVMTGKKISPPLNESMEILGKEECLNRVKTFLSQG